jgi:hypothetical protein
VLAAILVKAMHPRARRSTASAIAASVRRILGPAGVRSVPPTGAETELVGRQRAPWTRIKNGKSLSPKAVGRRRTRCPNLV